MAKVIAVLCVECSFIPEKGVHTSFNDYPQLDMANSSSPSPTGHVKDSATSRTFHAGNIRRIFAAFSVKIQVLME